MAYIAMAYIVMAYCISKLLNRQALLQQQRQMLLQQVQTCMCVDIGPDICKRVCRHVCVQPSAMSGMGGMSVLPQYSANFASPMMQRQPQQALSALRQPMSMGVPVGMPMGMPMPGLTINNAPLPQNQFSNIRSK